MRRIPAWPRFCGQASCRAPGMRRIGYSLPRYRARDRSKSLEQRHDPLSYRGEV